MQKYEKYKEAVKPLKTSYSQRRGYSFHKNRKRRRKNTQKSTFSRNIAAKAGCTARERKRRRKNKEKNICR